MYRTRISVSHGLVLLAILFLTAFSFSSCRTSKKGNVKEKERSEATVKVKGKAIKGIRADIVKEALTWEGTPYRYAGSEKGKGTDCSGMVLKVYEMAAGKKLPRNSARQAEFCKKLAKNSVKAGDLVFFATGKEKGKVSHVGIMIDEERFIHASGTKGVVISNITTPYYQRTFIMYGRVPGSED